MAASPCFCAAACRWNTPVITAQLEQEIGLAVQAVCPRSPPGACPPLIKLSQACLPACPLALTWAAPAPPTVPVGSPDLGHACRLPAPQKEPFDRGRFVAELQRALPELRSRAQGAQAAAAQAAPGAQQEAAPPPAANPAAAGEPGQEGEEGPQPPPVTPAAARAAEVAARAALGGRLPENVFEVACR